MQFQKGERGNPAGRPRAARNWVTVLVQDLLAAVAAGDLTPSEGADLADVIDVHVGGDGNRRHYGDRGGDSPAGVPPGVTPGRRLTRFGEGAAR